MILSTSETFGTMPSTWTPMPDGDDEIFKGLLIEVEKGTTEFHEVSSAMKKTMPTSSITKLERVQNRWLWDQYSHTRKRISMKNGGEAKELNLFHGTRTTEPIAVYNGQDGFDMRFSAKGMWGTGIYFAENALYSHSYCHNVGTTKQMFFARVIVGEFTKIPSNSALTIPPVKPTSKGRFKTERYDSVSGETGGSVIYIIYSNAQAYPEYLITYTA